MIKELINGQVGTNFSAQITTLKKLHGCMVVDKHSKLEKKVVAPIMPH